MSDQPASDRRETLTPPPAGHRALTLTPRMGTKVMICFEPGMGLWRLTQRIKTAKGQDMPRLALDPERSGAAVEARTPGSPTLFLCRI